MQISESKQLDGSWIGAELRKPRLLFALLCCLSIPLHFYNLDQPLVGEHEFRQTQTALSVWEIREHGFSVLHPKLPLFGPPWECPFEYPLFQVAAAAVDSVAPWTNLDVSIRLTGLLCFYLTALSLYCLGRSLFPGSGVALFGTGVFLFSPYNVFWSRASMIEYTAVFFGLVYLVTFIRWTRGPTRTLFVLCLCAGVLGALTKITTFAIPLLITGTLAGLHGLAAGYSKLKVQKSVGDEAILVARGPGLLTQEGTNHLRIVHIVALGCLLIIPVIAADWYVKYGDAIKEKSPFTAWLSSSHPYTKEWTYGTLPQRESLENWSKILGRLGKTVSPCHGLILLLGICLLPFRLRGFEGFRSGNFWVGCSLSLAPFVVALVFFNLYRIHSYYVIACAPFLALCAGLALEAIFKALQRPYLQLLFLMCVSGVWLDKSFPLLMQWRYAIIDSPRVDYLCKAADLIGKNDAVIVISDDWSAFAPYYLTDILAVILSVKWSEVA